MYVHCAPVTALILSAGTSKLTTSPWYLPLRAAFRAPHYYLLTYFWLCIMQLLANYNQHDEHLRINVHSHRTLKTNNRLVQSCKFNIGQYCFSVVFMVLS